MGPPRYGLTCNGGASPLRGGRWSGRCARMAGQESFAGRRSGLPVRSRPHHGGRTWPTGNSDSRRCSVVRALTVRPAPIAGRRLHLSCLHKGGKVSYCSWSEAVPCWSTQRPMESLLVLAPLAPFLQAPSLSTTPCITVSRRQTEVGTTLSTIEHRHEAAPVEEFDHLSDAIGYLDDLNKPGWTRIIRLVFKTDDGWVTERVVGDWFGQGEAAV